MMNTWLIEDWYVPEEQRKNGSLWLLLESKEVLQCQVNSWIFSFISKYYHDVEFMSIKAITYSNMIRTRSQQRQPHSRCKSGHWVSAKPSIWIAIRRCWHFGQEYASRQQWKTLNANFRPTITFIHHLLDP